MVDGPQNVYLSYHSIEMEFALRLAADLKNAGVNLWMDRLDIAPDDTWLSTLQNAPRLSAALIAVLSPDYVASQFCRQELLLAFQMGLPIFPVLLRPLPDNGWPAEVAGRQYIDFGVWPREDAYQEEFKAFLALLNAEIPEQFGSVPDRALQYQVSLIADILAQQAIDRYLDSLLLAADDMLDDPVRQLPPTLNPWLQAGWLAVQPQPAALPIRFQGIDGVAGKYERFVLVGPAGSGKTAVLQYLALEAARLFRSRPGSAPLPLVLKFVDWGDELGPVDFVRAHWPFETNPVSELAAGSVMLFLDGLSELGRAAAPKIARLREWLNGSDAPQRVVITCRSEDYAGDFVLDLPTVRVTDWDQSMARIYLAGYLGDDAARRTLESLSPEVGPAPSLRHLVRDPLLLSAYARAVGSVEKSTPTYSIGALLKQLVVDLWTRQAPRAALAFEELEAGLSALALPLIIGEQPVYVSYEFASEYLGNINLLLDRNSDQFLQVENGCVRFRHQVVRDYFAALRLQREDFHTALEPPAFGPDGYRLTRKWDRPIVILTGLVPNPEAMVREIAAVDPYLALECASSGVRLDKNSQDEAVGQLHGFLATTEQDGRVSAAHLLADHDLDAAVPVLLETMRSGSWAARWAATDRLRALKLPLLPGLTEALYELDQKQRDATAVGLRRLGEAAIPTLIQLIRDDNWFIRRSAAWGLGEVGDAAAVPALVEALHDAENFVSADAAMALGWLRDPVAVPWLQQLLRHENWRVREAGATALGWIGAPAVPGMLDELRDSPEDVRHLVIDALKNTHDHAVLRMLLEATYDEDVEVRSAAVEALERVEGDVFVKRLVECLADTARARHAKERICDIAARILEATGRTEALAAVERWRQREPAASVDAAEGQPASSRSSAEQAKNRLAGITVSRELESSLIASGLGSEEWQERRDTVASLAGQEAQTALPQLLKALRDEQAEVRIAALQALSTFDGEIALRGLIRGLSDDDYRVCIAAADGMKARGSEVTPHLLKALRSARVNIRGAAILTLGRIGDPATIEELSACLSDEEQPWGGEQRINDLAAAALEAIGTAEALNAVLDWRDAQTPAPPVETFLPALASQETAETLDNGSVAERPAAGEPAGRAEDQPGENGPDQAARPEDEHPPEEVVEVGQDGRGHREILLELLANLHQDDWSVRKNSAKALREYAKLLHGSSDEVILQRLLEALQDDEWEVRWAVAEALAWIGDTTAVPALIDRLTDENWIVRVAVIRALLEMNDTQAVPAITRALADKKDLVREAAAEALGELADPEAVAPLAQALSDPEDFVRLAAVQALGKLRDSRSVAALSRALQDSDSHIRWAAVIALGQVESSKAVPALTQALQDTDGPYWEEQRICDVAAEVLRTLDTPEAAAALANWNRPETENHT